MAQGGRGSELAVTGYSIALYLHLLFLLVSAAAAGLAGFGALQLRHPARPADVARWGMFIDRIVPVFPLTSLGLLASGAYMTQHSWSWSTPWIDAGIAGLAVIMALCGGVEGRHGRSLKHEVIANGLSSRAREMLLNPVPWVAKGMTITLMLAVVFVMTTKPGAAVSASALVVAAAVGALTGPLFVRTVEVRGAEIGAN